MTVESREETTSIAPAAEPATEETIGTETPVGNSVLETAGTENEEATPATEDTTDADSKGEEPKPEARSVLDTVDEADGTPKVEVPDEYTFSEATSKMPEHIRNQFTKGWKADGLSQAQADTELNRVVAIEQAAIQHRDKEIQQWKSDFMGKPESKSKLKLLAAGLRFAPKEVQDMAATNGLDWNPAWAPLWESLGKLTKNAPLHKGTNAPVQSSNIYAKSYADIKNLGRKG